MVAAAAWLPSSRRVSASRAPWMTAGSARLARGSERRRAQASACSIWSGGWLPAEPGLNAQPYSAARSTAGGGLPAAFLVSAGVMVASASAIPARLCAETCGHLTAA